MTTQFERLMRAAGAVAAKVRRRLGARVILK